MGLHRRRSWFFGLAIGAVILGVASLFEIHQHQLAAANVTSPDSRTSGAITFTLSVGQAATEASDLDVRLQSANVLSGSAILIVTLRFDRCPSGSCMNVIAPPGPFVLFLILNHPQKVSHLGTFTLTSLTKGSATFTIKQSS